MHMRMVVQTARMGVQHRHGTRLALQLLVVVAEVVDGVPGAVEQLGVKPALVILGQLPELGRHGEGQHEVADRHREVAK